MSNSTTFAHRADYGMLHIGDTPQSCVITDNQPAQTAPHVSCGLGSGNDTHCKLNLIAGTVPSKEVADAFKAYANTPNADGKKPHVAMCGDLTPAPTPNANHKQHLQIRQCTVSGLDGVQLDNTDDIDSCFLVAGGRAQGKHESSWFAAYADDKCMLYDSPDSAIKNASFSGRAGDALFASGQQNVEDLFTSECLQNIDAAVLRQACEDLWAQSLDAIGVEASLRALSDDAPLSACSLYLNKTLASNEDVKALAADQCEGAKRLPLHPGDARACIDGGTKPWSPMCQSVFDQGYRPWQCQVVPEWHACEKADDCHPSNAPTQLSSMHCVDSGLGDGSKVCNDPS